MKNAKDLMADRDRIDAEIAKNLEILEANNCTMDNPLTDAEDYPIASIDIYAVRHARHNIITLRNDRKAIMLDIEKIIEQIHQNPDAQMDDKNDEYDDEPPVHRTSNNPFLKVSSVTEGSPAAEGGFRENDQVIQYGQIHHGNFENLSQIATETTRRENKLIRVTVLRDDRPVRLQIRPHTWSGKGLLGCVVVPL